MSNILQLPYGSIQLELNCTFTNNLLGLIIAKIHTVEISRHIFLEKIFLRNENYFASQLIKCKDGSKSFTRDRLNDNFCDCVDGTNEPGTSACSRGKFYCRNLGSTPQFIFSSRINDRICDCCDGSDEYDRGVNCPNTCVMGGNMACESGSYISSIDIKESSAGILSDDLLQKVEGLKVVLLLQIVVFIIGVVIFCMLHRRVRSKRRRNRENA
ncbi:hypothetical protein K2173_004637 [Erythroxylum novogranatense]|uniref:Glucosidase II beta subunit N-terminal domain-containing protein n=1 Tax=Erythroxylum novogranatense TaxID=1862640 RepID=A0AAV8SYI9_9ROSI|nr:hypothetical protein K2173_004637 [Erythroxylum novogranatense]